MQSSRKITRGFIEDFISNSTQDALDLKADDNSVIHNTGNEVKDGNLILNDDLILPNIVDDISADVANVAISTVTNRLVTIPTELSSSGNIKVAVTNKTGSTILKGATVYIDGAQGSKATIALALADTNVNTSLALGIVENDIANNASGYVVAIGEITKIDTSAFTNGDKIYVSPTIAGGLTNVIPTSPNNVMFVGTVTNSHATQGKILINVLYTFKLDRLVDVSLNTLTNKDLLSYETSSGLWKNKSFTTLGLTTGTGTTNFLSKWSSTNGLTISQIFDDGTNVGVGTSSPSNAIHIHKNANSILLDGLKIDRDPSTTSSAIFNAFGGATNIVSNGGTTGVFPPLVFSISDDTTINERMRIATVTGNVLIGTTTDNGIDKLQVNGSLISSANKVTGGLSSQFQKGDGSLDSSAYTTNLGTVTSVSALTLGTTGTDLSSSVTNGTTTPTITLNVPTASASNRGALSSTDWSAFDNKQPQLNGTGFVKATGTTISYDNTTYTPSSRTLNINGNSFDLSANREWRVAQGDTGVLTFAGLTTNSATTINIGAVTGVIVDNETSPSTPSFVNITYVGETNKTVTTLGSGTESFVLLDNTGITFQNTFPTSSQRKSKIWLGKVSHPAGSITLVINEPDYITSPMAFTRDIAQSAAYRNKGVYPYANGSNLNVNVTAGSIVGDGINFVTDRTNPNILTVSPSVIVNMSYRTQLGGVTPPVTVVPVGFYDVAGVVTAVGGGSNSSTLQYFFLVPGIGYVVQYGQTVYSTLALAIAAVGREPLVIYPNLIENSILIGVLAVNKTASDLSDLNQAQFFKADIFGQIIGATAGTSTGTMQSAYNNSLTPQILTSTALGAVTVRRGSAADTDSVLKIQNGAGTDTFTVNGNGVITGTSIVKTSATSNDALIGDGTTLKLESGTYAPTLVNIFGTSGLSATTATYMRIGNIVTVQCSINATVTTAATTGNFSMTLPINRVTGASANYIGGGNAYNTGDVTLISQPFVHSSATTTAVIYFYAPINTATYNCVISFQYNINS